MVSGHIFPKKLPQNLYSSSNKKLGSRDLVELSYFLYKIGKIVYANLFFDLQNFSKLIAETQNFIITFSSLMQSFRNDYTILEREVYWLIPKAKFILQLLYSLTNSTFTVIIYKSCQYVRNKNFFSCSIKHLPSI